MQEKQEDQKFAKAPHLQLPEFLGCLVKSRNSNTSSHFLAAGAEKPSSQMPITICKPQADGKMEMLASPLAGV